MKHKELSESPTKRRAVAARPWDEGQTGSEDLTRPGFSLKG